MGCVAIVSRRSHAGEQLSHTQFVTEIREQTSQNSPETTSTTEQVILQSFSAGAKKFSLFWKRVLILVSNCSADHKIAQTMRQGLYSHSRAFVQRSDTALHGVPAWQSPAHPTVARPKTIFWSTSPAPRRAAGPAGRHTVDTPPQQLQCGCGQENHGHSALSITRAPAPTDPRPPPTPRPRKDVVRGVCVTRGCPSAFTIFNIFNECPQPQHVGLRFSWTRAAGRP